MGGMVSIFGYSSVAIRQAFGRKTVLLLLDVMHLYMFLSGTLSFADIMSRVRRHASQTVPVGLARRARVTLYQFDRLLRSDPDRNILRVSQL
jgi:hypothetical protein